MLAKRTIRFPGISGCRVQEQAPSIRYLLFAYDSFLFCKATEEEIREVRRILHNYKIQSGQVINLQKSGVFFSANVRMDKQMELKNLLEVHNDLSKGNYLGLPSLIGKSKKRVFNFLKDRMWSKI